MTKIGFVLGTRPEIIKLYPCIRYCIDNDVDYFVVNTDQHYDKNMRDIFFEELGLPIPKYSLNIGSASHAGMLAKMLVPIEDVLLAEKPDVVVVQGDTNTVLAGCLAAIKINIKVAHVEAGLRSYDRTMPEEHNRVLTDHASDFLFAPAEKQADILRSEGIREDRIFVTGNTIVDAVYSMTNNLKASKERYVLLTCHRPSNTDNQSNFASILSAVQTICEKENIRCIFPMHPRLKAKANDVAKYDRIDIIDPLGYRDLLQIAKNAHMIFTDSGGIQEEACIMKKKCVILRENTERPETLQVGGAVLLNEISKDDILEKYRDIKLRKVNWYNPFGDGKAGSRIIKILVKNA